MKNNFKYSLLNTGQIIELPIVYKTVQDASIKRTYLITQELLDEFDVSCKKMIQFLKGNLKNDDSSFIACSEIFNTNLPLEKASHALEVNSNFTNEIVTRIITNKNTWEI